MKKILFLSLTATFFCILPLFSQLDPEDRRGVYLNFEEEAEGVDIRDVTAYGCETKPVFEEVANEYRNGDFDDFNTSNVGKITTTACTDEGIQIDNEFVINFSPRPWIAVDVVAPAPDLNVVLRLEDFNDSETFVQREVTTVTSGEFERLEFDFTGEESGKYGRIILMVDVGGVAEGEQWYFDNIKQRQPEIGYPDGMLVNFEDKNPWWHFWGCTFEVISNPDPSGLNTSENVGYFITGESTYEGAGFYEKYYPFDFTGGTSFSLLVYAPAADRTVRFKLERFENKNDSPVSLDATTTKEMEWEMLTVDFADLETEPLSDFYSKIAVFPDFGGTTAEEDWFIDDIKFNGTPTAPPAGVKDVQPAAYQLAASNYPNPFNPGTTISYAIPKTAKVTLTVFDILGKQIVTLVNETIFDGADQATGVYFYTLTADEQILTGKMLLIK
jgi:hypothetical protein